MSETHHEEVRVAILGAGVTGLCAAHHAALRFGKDAVLVCEAAETAGGATRTESMDGFTLDWGPNGFLNREPRTLEWIQGMGQSDRLHAANEAAAHRFILKNNELVEVVPPPGFLMTSLLSVRGRLRLMCEPLIPARRGDAPESIYDFAARRIGREAAETMVAPMVTGIFGGDAKALSLAHCFPRMAAMERDYGSLTRALLAKRRTNKAASPIGPSGVLTTFREGIGFLPQAACAHLAGRVRLGARAECIERRGAGYRVTLGGGAMVDACGVIVAMPAYAAADAVGALDADLAGALKSIAYADISVVCTGYCREKVRHALDGFGFLVPPRERKRVLGCLWTSSLFPGQAPVGSVLLRSMFGGYADRPGAHLSDRELLDCLAGEVHPLLGIDSPPEWVRVFRHAPGIPQYLLRHGELLAAIDAGEARHPGLTFAGNAYRGVGLNDCVLSAIRAVDRLP